LVLPRPRDNLGVLALVGVAVGRTIADRLSEAASRSFVGREAELEFLRTAIEADEPPFLVAYVHGPGGIGKSRLLQAAVHTVAPPARALALDCARVEPTPRGFLVALGDLIGLEEPSPERVAGELGAGERVALALDTYETFGLLDTWLRQTFLPALPETALTLIASRAAPKPAWTTSPGWEGLFHPMELRGLDGEEARRMLSARGLSDEQAERVSRFAHGHPLALELAAAAVRTTPELDVADGPPPAVLQALTQAFLAGLPPDTAEAVEAASVLRRLTVPALGAVTGRSGIDPFEEIRELPFVRLTDEGLALHDVVRDTVARELMARDPERHRLYRSRALRFITRESYATQGLGLWQSTADLLFLIQNPNVREGFFPAGASQMSVESAGAGDGSAIARITEANEPREAADIVRRWWRAAPDRFHVARDATGAVAAMYLLIEPIRSAPLPPVDDPVIDGWLAHLEEHPVGPEERVLFLRRWLDLETGDLPSPGQGACWVDIKRTYMEMRPRLRRLYATSRTPEVYAPSLGALGFVPLPAAAVDIGGETYHSVMLDFGEGSIDGWLRRVAGVDVGADESDERDVLPQGTVTIMFTDIADSTALTEALGDKAFRERARGLESGLRVSIGEGGGAVIEGKLLGDGLLAVFTSACQAVECAARSVGIAEMAQLGLHVGLHAGDVLREDGNVFGGAVNIAARVAAAAPPGEVLVSDTVRSLARTSVAVAFDDRGDHRLKGVSDPVRLFALVP
jgi:class 3 adenylate cyclase